MGPDNHADLVLLKELVHDIWSVCHYVILSCRVSYCVSLHAWHFVGGRWITPQDVHAHLLDCVSDATESNSERPLDLVDIFKLYYRVSDTTMDAQDAILILLLKKGSEGHPFEQIIDLLEDTVGVVDILIEPLCTFLTETQILVYVTILMIASK